MLTQSQLSKLFSEYIVSNNFDQQPPELYSPINYIMSIGGKRLRPILLLMSTQLFNEEVQDALPAAFAVEVFHNFSLLHDDIMDEAPLRRGRPTVHIKYGVNSGILSGDVMLIYAYEFLRKYKDAELVAQLLKTFNKVAIEVCEGQQYDMNFETQSEVKLNQYLKMIELKTAALIGGSIKLGALIGGAKQQDVDHLEAFGRNIGIAFQLQDDILDTFGDPEKFGKKVGGDIAQNKKTFLVLKSLELADMEVRSELTKWMTMPAEDELTKIKAVTSIFKKIGIEQLAKEKKNEYLNIAFDHLAQVSVEDYRKEPLKNIAKQLTNRDI